MYNAATRQTVARRALQFSRAQFRLNSTAAKPKKKHPVRSFFWKLGFWTTVVYTGATAVALKSDSFQDAFIDYFPFAEDALDLGTYITNHKDELLDINTYRIQSIGDIKEKLSNLDKTTSIPHSGAQSSKVDPTILGTSAASSSPSPDSKKLSTSAPSPAEKKLQIPLLTLETDNPDIQKTVGSINDFIASINKSSASVDAEKLVATVSDTVSDLSTKYAELASSKKSELEKYLNDKSQELTLQYNEQKVKLTKEFTDSLAAAKVEIEKKHNDILKTDLKAARESILAEAQNVIVKSKNDTIDEFNAVITEKIENERNGKLKNLAAVIARLEEMEKFELELSKSAAAYSNYKAIKISLNKIQQLLTTNEPSSNAGKALASELSTLESLTSPLQNELIDSAVNSLPSQEYILKTGGVLTQSQLISRWELLLPELRSVSLLPPNAGLLGHISSVLFSKLLFSKAGAPVKTNNSLTGNDVESVIARVNDYLLKNELDNAVEEVSSLKGWSRKLADDWLVESRKKLELQFLVDLIDTELTVSA